MRTHSPSGIEMPVLAETAYKAYQNAAGEVVPPLPEWDKLPGEAQDDWLAAAMLSVSLIEGLGDEGEVAWRDLARSLYAAYLRRRVLFEGASPELAEQPNWVRLAWEAVARHLAHLVDADPGEITEFEALESAWRGWAQKRLQRSMA